jgi:putative membrane protein
MTALPPEKFTNITNELAKERNRAAAERTLNAWLGTCLSLIGLGFAVDQIVRSLQQRFPAMNPALTQDTASLIGLGVIGLGLLLLGFALIQHRLEISSIERHHYLLSSVYALNRLVVPAILLLGVAGLGVILFLR